MAAVLGVAGIVAVVKLARTPVPTVNPVPAASPDVDDVPQPSLGQPSTWSPNDSRECIACHAEIVASYARSGMSQTWRAVAAGVAPGVRGTADVVDHAAGYRYHIRATDAGIEQIESRADRPSHQLRRHATYLIGSGKHATAAVTTENGYLTQMPAAWFRHDQAWRMNPGFELHNHRFDRPITPGCLSCHGATAVHQSPTANRYDAPVGAGITCQRCHGQTESHVVYWSAADAATGGGVSTATDDPAAVPSPSLAATVEMSPGAANDVCLQCHLQGDATVYASTEVPLQLPPGERLLDDRHDFLVDSGDATRLGVASHGARMLRSRCYTASDGALTCTLCHDPHRPTADFSAAHYNSKCATCHLPESCDRRREETPDGDSNCVACHMPQRSSLEGIHLVFTDHAILRERPAQEVIDRSATTLLSNASNVQLVSAWPTVRPDHATLGAAYVMLHETMGPQRPSLELRFGHISCTLFLQRRIR